MIKLEYTRLSNSYLKILVAAVMLVSFIFFGQESVPFDSLKSFPNTEDLSKKSYEELIVLEDKSYDNMKWDELRVISEYHVNKAKSDMNQIEIARGFYYRTFIERKEVALAYADSIILITQGSNNSRYPTLGYLLKAGILYDSGDYRPSLNVYLKAFNLAVKKDNFEDQLTSSIAIGAIRNVTGQPYAAAEIYTQILKKLNAFPDNRDYLQDYNLLLYNLTLSHMRMGQLDSAQYYFQNGLERTLNQGEELKSIEFKILGAEIDYLEKNYQRANDTLKAYTNYFEGTEKANKLYYLAKIALDNGENIIAAKYFLQIDSIINVTHEPIDEVRDVYQNLALHYASEDNGKKEVEYLQKLIHFDSVIETDRKKIAQSATQGYDIPILKLQKQRVEKELRSRMRLINALYLVSFLSILLGTYFIINNRLNKKRIKILLNNGLRFTPNKNETAVIQTPLQVPGEIKKSLLERLEVFEKSDRFLDHDLKMQDLAHELETNTSYLSTTINQHKGMSFPNYLKKLRITRAVERIANDSSLMKYNYQGLAETFGFKSGDSFSKAFHSYTGVYPSSFIKEIKNRQKNDDL